MLKLKKKKVKRVMKTLLLMSSRVHKIPVVKTKKLENFMSCSSEIKATLISSDWLRPRTEILGRKNEKYENVV